MNKEYSSGVQKSTKEWERLFLEQFAKNPDITFESLFICARGGGFEMKG